MPNKYNEFFPLSIIIPFIRHGLAASCALIVFWIVKQLADFLYKGSSILLWLDDIEDVLLVLVFLILAYFMLSDIVKEGGNKNGRFESFVTV